MTTPRRSLRRTALAAVASASALALALTGCQGGSAADDAPVGDPVAGGDLTIAVGNDPTNLNPSGNGAGNDTWYVTRQLVDSLLYQNPDTNELEPWLAESYEVNDDATVYTFHLRDDVTFSDGTPLTANEVKGTFDDIVEAGAQSYAFQFLDGYEATNVIDEHTAEVVFSTPNSGFANATAIVGLGIVGAATLEVPYEERNDGQAVVGTGPFTLGSYTTDVSTVLEKRGDYAWAPASLGNDGAAYLDSVTFQIVPEAGNRTGNLASGQVDVAGGIQPIDVPTLEGQGYNVMSRGNPGMLFGVGFNLGSDIVSDPAVREAISHATNPQEIVDTSLGELFAVGTSPLSSTTPGWADQSQHYTFDTAEAESILDGAGWVAGSDGVREKDGERLSLTLAWMTNFGPNQTSLELLQQQLAAIGIEIELVGGPVPDYLERTAGGDFDLAWANFSLADPDALRFQFDPDGRNNFHIDDAELATMFDESLAAAEPAERDGKYAEIQEYIASNAYYVPVHELTTIIGSSEQVQGLQFGADSRLNSLVATWLNA
ncbi:ABC transporter substrate-binding protein [Pseudoclavibacter endophyticus]|uniref:ABC transporter substrate-binding protein n=1 Tax=Pseudoclavibacter endophyticus TaxID=1778590 RepID=A0A6H9WH98_9MICO|nr:ABC transporter substrate-binding protein [Pseudoclavibacter endophyticus]KAB1650282.1 ABC transporter substrate-binding protein [Pseudoclavibacter endophyticus]GGA55505.1 ABC transporter substrate-binding protein [Pseudoclavibacter endophyticus]